MTPITISESATEPITLEEAAENLRAQDDGNSPPTYFEAATITRLIKAARQACEQELEHSLVAKTLEVAVPAFGAWIDLPGGPVREVLSVTYTDPGGAEVTLAADQYRFSGYVRTPVLMPAFGVTWPAARGDMDAVRVRYTVGYPSTDSPPQEVPEPIRQAMHLAIAHWFSNREAVDQNTLAELPMGVRYLLGKYRQGLGV
jgi:uncharacterized phiE125 gp8 family phage protein